MTVIIVINLHNSDEKYANIEVYLTKTVHDYFDIRIKTFRDDIHVIALKPSIYTIFDRGI